VALAAARQELEAWTGAGDLAARLQELRELGPAVETAAEEALHGGIDDAASETVEHALARLEAALRARTAHG
jgi:hypothetical protein